MYVPLAIYSFRISFCIVPRSCDCFTPCDCPVATYIANNIDAGALIVILVETVSRGTPSNNSFMSSIVSMATPTFPTSPCDIGSSLSYPI